MLLNRTKAQFTTKSNLERHVLRRHGVLDKEGQAKYIIKLSQQELQRQLDEENGGDPAINNELFGAEQDDRRNKIISNQTVTVRPQTTQVAPKEKSSCSIMFKIPLFANFEILRQKRQKFLIWSTHCTKFYFWLHFSRF